MGTGQVHTIPFTCPLLPRPSTYTQDLLRAKSDLGHPHQNHLGFQRQLQILDPTSDRRSSSNVTQGKSQTFTESLPQVEAAIQTPPTDIRYHTGQAWSEACGKACSDLCTHIPSLCEKLPFLLKPSNSGTGRTPEHMLSLRYNALIPQRIRCAVLKMDA